MRGFMMEILILRLGTAFFLGSGEQKMYYAAPTRATDLSSLPPTWIDVGAAEVFRDESVAYATKLWEFSIETELHVWLGTWHAFDIYAPDTEIFALCLETRMAWMKRTLEPVSKSEKDLL